jgi:hypothetical protein
MAFARAQLEEKLKCPASHKKTQKRFHATP